jgi:hypothetical protein
LRHFPALAPALSRLPNPFVPWNPRLNPRLTPFKPTAYDIEMATLRAQGKRRPGNQNREPQPVGLADTSVQTLRSRPRIGLDDLPANPTIDCSLNNGLKPLQDCLGGASRACCAGIDAVFAPGANATTRNCLCMPAIATEFLRVGLGFGVNFVEVRRTSHEPGGPNGPRCKAFGGPWAPVARSQGALGPPVTEAKRSTPTHLGMVFVVCGAVRSTGTHMVGR